MNSNGWALIRELLVREHLDLDLLALSWAKSIPIVFLIPALGLRGLSPAVRASFALFLALCLLAGQSHPLPFGGPWALELLVSAIDGTVVAIAAAVPTWAIVSAGGYIDQMRGVQEPGKPTFADSPTQSFGSLHALVAGICFLGLGGPALTLQAVSKASHAPVMMHTLSLLVDGAELSVLFSGPVLCGAVIVEITLALITRAASPAHVQALLSPIRSFAILAIATFSFRALVQFFSATTIRNLAV